MTRRTVLGALALVAAIMFCVLVVIPDVIDDDDDGTTGSNSGFGDWPTAVTIPRRTPTAVAIGPTTGASTGTSTGQPTATASTAAYRPQPVAPKTTTSETKSLVTNPGEKATLSLSDGSKVELDASDTPLAVTLTRQSNDLDLADTGQVPSGAMRVLTYARKAAKDSEVLVASASWPAAAVDGGQAIPAEAEPAPIPVPVITIPAKEAGQLQIINAARVSDLMINNQLYKARKVFLPVVKDADGNLVMRDIFISLTPHGSQVKISVSSPQEHANWSVDPLLVRMVPSKDRAPLYRKTFDDMLMSDEDREQELKKPVRNVVVFVHGHNEAERRGWEKPEVDEPWKFAYKRDVWSLFYKQFLESYPDYVDCTAFYEFVYPTYRPIYEGTVGSDALGYSLARAIALEFARTPQLGEMAKAGDLNLFLVAHSMGGLVSRAAINLFAPDLERSFRKLVTWGSPHHGSALVTMRYLLYGAYDLRIKESCVALPPLSWLTQYAFFEELVEALAVDTPGEADLRWDNVVPLNLKGRGWSLVAPEKDYPDKVLKEINLETGTRLYNTGLQALNREDRYGDRYVTLYGTTGNVGLGMDFTCEGLAAVAALPDIYKGRQLTAWMTNNDATFTTDTLETFSVKANDGAVSILSMTAFGIAAEAKYVGEIDHEQYFGTPVGTSGGDFKNSGAAATMSKTTLGILGFRAKGEEVEEEAEVCQCPQLWPKEPASGTAVSTGGDAELTVSGSLQWPGDQKKAGKRIKQIAVIVDEFGKGYKAEMQFEVADDGSFTGQMPVSGLSKGLHTVTIFLQLTGNTILKSKPLGFDVGTPGIFRLMETKREDPKVPPGQIRTYSLSFTDTSYKAQCNYKTGGPRNPGDPPSTWIINQYQASIDGSWTKPPETLKPGDKINLSISLAREFKSENWQGGPPSMSLSIKANDEGVSLSEPGSKTLTFTIPSGEEVAWLEIEVYVYACELSPGYRTFAYRYAAPQ